MSMRLPERAWFLCDKLRAGSLAAGEGRRTDRRYGLDRGACLVLGLERFLASLNPFQIYFNSPIMVIIALNIIRKVNDKVIIHPAALTALESLGLMPAVTNAMFNSTPIKLMKKSTSFVNITKFVNLLLYLTLVT